MADRRSSRNGSRSPLTQEGFMENIVGGLAKTVADQLFDNLSLQSASYVRQHAKPGDLLEFHRGLYSHYALYLGQGKVMNVDAEEKTTKSALICEKNLEDVCAGCRVHVRNHDDIAKKYFQCSPKSMHEIIHTAKSYKNTVVPYELHFRNCEYYSTLWRYGKGFSTQVAKPTLTPAGYVIGGALTKASIATKAFVQSTVPALEKGSYAQYKKIASMF